VRLWFNNNRNHYLDDTFHREPLPPIPLTPLEPFPKYGYVPLNPPLPPVSQFWSGDFPHPARETPRAPTPAQDEETPPAPGLSLGHEPQQHTPPK
jgi:hypothetical protein